MLLRRGSRADRCRAGRGRAGRGSRSRGRASRSRGSRGSRSRGRHRTHHLQLLNSSQLHNWEELRRNNELLFLW